jgi:hypothetical protein
MVRYQAAGWLLLTLCDSHLGGCQEISGKRRQQKEKEGKDSEEEIRNAASVRRS